MPLCIDFIDLTKAFDLISRGGSSSEPFEIRSGVKQGCAIAPTLFGIFFVMLLKHAFDTTTEGTYLRTLSDRRLFNLTHLLGRIIFLYRRDDWEASLNSRSSHGSSVDTPQTVCEDTYGGLQCLCYQRYMDYICRAEEKAQHILPEKHPPYPGNILARQSNQR